jgi:glycosyltransferase involved in cell wall biosynthesis
MRFNLFFSKTTIRVLVLCFNHEHYIAKCLQSINMQVSEYPVFVTIYDDCSTDKSREIIENEMSKSPHQWELIVPPFNQYQKGTNILHSFFSLFKETFIARLDGDDYWTDNFKLQKQADRLLADKTASICHTKFSVLQDGQVMDEWPPRKWAKDLGGEHLAEENFIGSLTVMFRNSVYQKNIPAIFKKSKLGDYVTWALLSINHKISYIDDNTATYRIHNNNTYANLNSLDKLLAIIEAKCFAIKYSQSKFIHLWKQSILKDLDSIDNFKILGYKTSEINYEKNVLVQVEDFKSKFL